MGSQRAPGTQAHRPARRLLPPPLVRQSVSQLREDSRQDLSRENYGPAHCRADVLRGKVPSPSPSPSCPRSSSGLRLPAAPAPAPALCAGDRTLRWGPGRPLLPPAPQPGLYQACRGKTLGPVLKASGRRASSACAARGTGGLLLTPLSAYFQKEKKNKIDVRSPPRTGTASQALFSLLWGSDSLAGARGPAPCSHHHHHHHACQARPSWRGRWVRPENPKLLFSAQNAFAHMNAPPAWGMVPLLRSCLGKRRPVITTSRIPSPGKMAVGLPERAALGASVH